MAVKIRLMRVGKKKQPTYRVVVADARSPRDGRFIEIIGRYEPRQDPSVVLVDADRAVHWLRQGAQPTEQTAKLFEISGVWDAYKTATGKDSVAKPKAKTPKAKAEKPVPEAPPAATIVEPPPVAAAEPEPAPEPEPAVEAEPEPEAAPSEDAAE